MMMTRTTMMMMMMTMTTMTLMMTRTTMMMMMMIWIKTDGSSAALIDFKADRWQSQLGSRWHPLTIIIIILIMMTIMTFMITMIMRYLWKVWGRGVFGCQRCRTLVEQFFSPIQFVQERRERAKNLEELEQKVSCLQVWMPTMIKKVTYCVNDRRV